MKTNQLDILSKQLIMKKESVFETINVCILGYLVADVDAGHYFKNLKSHNERKWPAFKTHALVLMQVSRFVQIIDSICRLCITLRFPHRVIGVIYVYLSVFLARNIVYYGSIITRDRITGRFLPKLLPPQERIQTYISEYKKYISQFTQSRVPGIK